MTPPCPAHIEASALANAPSSRHRTLSPIAKRGGVLTLTAKLQEASSDSSSGPGGLRGQTGLGRKGWSAALDLVERQVASSTNCAARVVSH